MRHAVTVDNLVVDGRQASFTVSRVDARVVQGADMHSAKPVAARAEYYVVPMAPSSASKAIEPLISFDTLEWIRKDAYDPMPQALIVNPAKKLLMPYMDRQGVINSTVFPSNNQRTFWHRSGLKGYAYADAASHLLTYVPHEGDPCTIGLPAEMGIESLGNGMDALALSNDGRYIAIGHKRDKTLDMHLYEGCRQIGNRALRANDRLIGVCVSGGDDFFVLDSSRDNDVFVLSGNSELKYVLPGQIWWQADAQRSLPFGPPVFACEQKKFFWLGLRNQDGEGAAVNLYQYDPLTKAHSTLALQLGSRLN